MISIVLFQKLLHFNKFKAFFWSKANLPNSEHLFFSQKNAARASFMLPAKPYAVCINQLFLDFVCLRYTNIGLINICTKFEVNIFKWLENARIFNKNFTQGKYG